MTVDCLPSTVSPLDLTVIILTYNEEMHLARAIKSVEPIAKRILIVDSFSKDATVAIAHAAGADVLQHPFENQARQFSWAIEAGALDTAWIFRLDADEVIEPDLVNQLVETLPTLAPNITGINLKRKHIYMDRWIRHGGRYPLLMLRIFRKGKARMEDRWMDEHLVLTEGRTITLNGGFADHNLNDLGFFTDKHNRYATREAIEVLKVRHGLSVAGDQTIDAKSTSSSVATKRWIKTHIYNRIPFPIAAMGYFLYRYFVQLGFLDGRPGTVYHVLQGFWYRFLVGSRTWELEQAVKHLQDPEAVRRELTRLTGHEL